MRTVQSLQLSVVRGMATFLGLFTLARLLGAQRVQGFDATFWWLDLRFLPGWFHGPFSLLAAISLLACGFGPPSRPSLRKPILLVVLTAAIIALHNTLSFYALWHHGEILTGLPIPFSLIVLGVLALVVWTLRLPPSRPSHLQRLVYLVSFIACLVLVPLAQIAFFGRTDYRRSADAIVVFGALVHADGTPSQVLSDRVHTAVELYQQGRAPLLVFSGGPGAGPTSEPMAMRTLAVALGVPSTAIVLDEHGINTQATAANTAALFRQRHIRSALAVSNDYHLPRIKLTYARALWPGNPCRDVFTVPAHESAPLVAKPHFIAREIAALWVYYLRPLWRA